ncbi:MAG: acetoacetate decarboxylase family protein [Oscillospiraceae bacterium]
MKILSDFDATLLQNDDKFEDAFFKRFSLKKHSVRLSDSIEKDYSFPTFYGDVTCSQAIFLCSYEEALKLMPHEKIKPVRALKGRAVLAISCYEYKNVMGIPPYNEVALTIAVQADKTRNPVLLPLMFNNYSGYYVFSMPVTSRENCIRGNTIWGLPKVTQEIDIDISGDEAVTVCREADGTEYFRLRVPKAGKLTKMDETTYLYTKLNGKILKARTDFKGDFAISKNMGVLLKPEKSPDKPFLTLSDTPCGKAIKKLKIDPTPLQLRYVEHMNSCFDFYDETYELR